LNEIVLSLATSIIAVHYAEIALKGRNRPMFLRRLRGNMQAALRNEPVTGIAHTESRLLVRLSDPSRAEAAAAKLRKVFGIQWLSPAVQLPRDEADENLDGLCRLAADLAARDRGDARHFKIAARRSDRGFKLTSPEINRIVGAAVKERLELPVRMVQPDLTVHVLVMKDAVLVFSRKIKAFGGLPAGTGGNVAVLLSGGIDSPVAAWMLMKRGCRPEFIHFFAGRSVEEAETGKIRQLAVILNEYSPVPLRLYLVPVFAYEARAIGNISSHYDMVLFRRFMIKTAERLAARTGCRALVTGDSLGQVASQTLANLAAISSDVTIPIFRPLIGLDKWQITELAMEVGTYKTSILPYRDCCSIRSPRPVLNARTEDLLRFSDVMDLEEAIEEAVAAAVTLTIAPEATQALSEG
jgi:thiamine biosynthesis protein ThiI